MPDNLESNIEPLKWRHLLFQSGICFLQKKQMPFSESKNKSKGLHFNGSILLSKYNNSCLASLEPGFNFIFQKLASLVVF